MLETQEVFQMWAIWSGHLQLPDRVPCGFSSLCVFFEEIRNFGQRSFKDALQREDLHVHGTVAIA